MRHYKRIKLEGNDLTGLVNRCIRKGITLRSLKWHDPLESTFEFKGDDSEKIKKIAGHSYKITVLREGGFVPAFRTMKTNIAAIIGAFLVGALIFYQGLFVAEIRVSGYENISETEIRQTLKSVGLYEGARKQGTYEDVKKALFANYENITWASIYEKGRLVEVDIAQAKRVYQGEKNKETPAHIVATKSGMIEQILPLKGSAVVQKGDYVKEGDILISGKYEYQSSDYSKGDKIFKLYSHAEGRVLARVPESQTYYFEKNVRNLEPTGKMLPGIYVKIGDFELDTTDGHRSFETSQKTFYKAFSFVRPIPLQLYFTRVREVKAVERPQKTEEMQTVAEAALRQYERENLGKNEMILDSSFSFHEEANTIRVSAMLELLEEIGEEKHINQKNKR
ncbi:MAG: sporulation protein YqfD [Clostridiales bacterium]|nr:sporulation protein YqfD [Clostridiales bacterium]